MPSSLFTGVTGLLAHQRRLDIVAHNLANLNTTAFKTNRGVFADLFYQTLAPATAGNAVSIGGTNPNQIGGGVRVAQITKNFNQGSLEATSQPFDFALDGDGFFVVDNGTDSYYTRAGAFSLDNDGYLVDPSSGYYVTRFGTVGEGTATLPAFQVPGDTRIQIPLGINIPGQPTAQVDLDGNLDSTATGPLPQILNSAGAFQVAGAPATAATLLNSLDSNSVAYVAGDMIDISGTNADGSAFSTSFAAGPATTLGALVSAINGVLTDSVASLDASGNIVVTANNNGPGQLTLDLADAAGNTGVTDFASHRMIETQSGSLGDTFTGVFDFFDPQGAAHSLTFDFQKTGNNTWDLDFSMNPADGTITGGTFSGISFNDDGTLNLASFPSNASITANVNGFGSPQTIAVGLGLTQIATASGVLPSQDGYAPSQLVTVRANSDGELQGVTSNGLVVPVAQLAVAKFANSQGLTAVGGNYFDESLNSGLPQVGAATTGGRGAVHGGQLESSNVDVAYEFTQLIVAQRGFSANARTISVADEVLEELTNIVR